MSDLKAAGAICFVREGKKVLFLVLRSTKHGEWGPPKGHAEEGESEVETAAREIYEEAGLRRVTFILNFREVLNYGVDKKGARRNKEAVYFLCEIDPEQVRLSHEHSEVHYATLDEIEVLIQHEDMREVFRKAQKTIIENPVT